jgi:hypothetical protein
MDSWWKTTICQKSYEILDENLKKKRMNLYICDFIKMNCDKQSVPITTNVVNSNLDQGEVYNIMW